jgi:hypothetical protein
MSEGATTSALRRSTQGVRLPPVMGARNAAGNKPLCRAAGPRRGRHYPMTILKFRVGDFYQGGMPRPGRTIAASGFRRRAPRTGRECFRDR